MARKSRKRQTVTLPHLHSETAGYIRLSVTGKGGDDSIENQKKVIEAWARENQHPISRWYIDAGWSGRTFYRPMFRELIADIERGEVDCVVVKDLSRLGRDHIAVGYYLEVFFPMNCVRFVSINDDFDTVNGLTDQSHPHGARIRIPIKNAFNEQVAVEIKQKVEATLQMKIDLGTFVGPRAPFGYQKSEANHDQLVPDPIASITVRKIFELAANGTGVTGIVRYLNEKELPTPIQYARSNGLTGSFADGTGDWNSRSVKYILTNRTYTGMLIQGKEKRVVKGTHEPLVDVETFDRIQSEFKARSFNISPTPEASENVFKGKVICACCGGKMQRKRGTNHADWYFFTCISKNRLGADKCTGMYAREEDVLSAVYYQLKQYMKWQVIRFSGINLSKVSAIRKSLPNTIVCCRTSDDLQINLKKLARRLDLQIGENYMKRSRYYVLACIAGLILSFIGLIGANSDVSLKDLVTLNFVFDIPRIKEILTNIFSTMIVFSATLFFFAIGFAKKQREDVSQIKKYALYELLLSVKMQHSQLVDYPPIDEPADLFCAYVHNGYEVLATCDKVLAAYENLLTTWEQETLKNLQHSAMVLSEDFGISAENFREYSATQFCNFYDEKVRTAPQNEKINVFTHKIKTDIEKYSKHIEQFCEDFKHYY